MFKYKITLKASICQTLINKKYGYAQVSSQSQQTNSSLESKEQELIQKGILESNIIIEVGSAANEIKNRPGFQNLIQNVLKEGDTLVVSKFR